METFLAVAWGARRLAMRRAIATSSSSGVRRRPPGREHPAGDPTEHLARHRPRRRRSPVATATPPPPSREDSVYPDVGEPDVDALHYGLDIRWEPDRRRLVGDGRDPLPGRPRPPTGSGSTWLRS